MKDNDEEKADTVEQPFNLDYDVAQAFCSHIVPIAVIFLTGEALDNGMDFEHEDGNGRSEESEIQDQEEGGTDTYSQQEDEV